ncbi:MAG TPA: hypothetical protein PLS29_07780 [Acidimicrobiales bacterium]|nr:MAG: hypothetical protein B7Z69_00105 [Actinobacteria bacterium 21-73-9]HQU26911.1 hypothetical protein [Acidimicrobiales bacterium]
MALDPRTPVVVGVGQVTVPPDAGHGYDDRPTPLDLMCDALEAAADDAGAGDALLARLDEVVAISSFVWHPRDPAGLVLETLGLAPRPTALAPTGGSQPQRLVAASARRIAAGELDAIAIVGAEAMYAHLLARREGRPVDWPGHGDAPTAGRTSRDPFTAEERRHGLALPVGVYPLFENARRARRGWSIDEHRARLGALWAGFARVAAHNPYAWRRDAPDAATIATPSATNRMIGFPYTKLLVANLPVDMGASLVVTSYERARELGVAHEKMVFPQCAAEAEDHWFISERPDLDRSPAMEAVWGALGEFGVEESVDLVDLYSCFPTVVQTAGEVIGLDPFDATRPPTVTGGLTFAGGPDNNYVTHAIATMVERLRARPESAGLVTGLGWFSTEHAWGAYRATPPATGFRWRDVQGLVDATPRVEVATGDGEVVVETYTVTHRPDGSPERLVVCARRADGRRQWAHSEDPDLCAHAEQSELLGARLSVLEGRVRP